ncbi:MAG: hypothetical protein K2Q21_11455 [Chitinophagaceae bacterium]|nr:hypothetical protein [Chitinophagaceae bacterium]
MFKIKLMLILFLLIKSQISFCQSAIGQLENITGQKINRYNTSNSSGYNMNSMISGMLAQSMVNAIFSSNAKNYAQVKEVTVQPTYLVTTIQGEKQRVELALRVEKYKRLMKAYKFLKDSSSLQYANYQPKKSGLDRLDSSWLVFQQKMIRERLNHENYWCKQYYQNLQKKDSGLNTLGDMIPHKNAGQLEAGDVILIGPTSGNDYFSAKQASLDAWANDNNANVTHTVTCVKVVNGKRMFLDNQATEGPRLISEEEFYKRYQDRETSVASLRQNPWGVAQPLNKDEAEQLWNKARDMAQKNRDNTNPLATNYGLYGNDNMVCSESSWQLMNATGRYHIPFSKSMPLITGIDFSPASFYSNQQYFLITPLQMSK